MLGIDKGIVVIFWEGVEDMDVNLIDDYKVILVKILYLFVKLLEINFYEIVIEILLELCWI